MRASARAPAASTAAASGSSGANSGTVASARGSTPTPDSASASVAWRAPGRPIPRAVPSGAGGASAVASHSSVASTSAAVLAWLSTHSRIA